MISEEFLYFIWEHGLYLKKGLRTTCGKQLEVLLPGIKNIHAGPDYTNARIRAGGLIWAGNVEIHSCSAQWVKHGHQLDPAYNNVILHVVHQFEGEIYNFNGCHVFTLVLLFPGQLYTRFEDLVGNKRWLACSDRIRNVPATLQRQWILQLAKKRLEEKSEPGFSILSDLRLSREETLYRAMAAGFGLPNNTLPFQWLASGIPVQLLIEIKENLSDLEAVLFGHSGLISHSGTGTGTYSRILMEKYRNFGYALSGRPVPCHFWQFLRLRPAAFPTVRVALFASFLHLRLPFAHLVLQTLSLSELEQLLRVKASAYWDFHYFFEKDSPPSPKYLGPHSVQLLIINVVVPFLHAVGRAEKQMSILRRASDLMHQVEAESNHIIKNWINFGIKPRNAFESQGLIQLHHKYCRQKQCLQCMIGAFILGATVDEKIQP
jgi:hypothetical protein